MTLLAGCYGLPPGAYLVDTTRVETAWAYRGYKECSPGPLLFVYETTPEDVMHRCYTSYATGSCLVHQNISQQKWVWMAVVSMGYPEGWVHEALHMMAECAYGYDDPNHEGPWWKDVGPDLGVP